MHRERAFRGISRRLAVHYLQDMGGQALDDDGEPVEDGGETPEAAARVDRVVADAWTASLATEAVDVGPTLQLTEVTVGFHGDDDAVEEVVERFARKAMRAGG
ncbi:MAG: hypothetical protein ABEI96_03425 [Haloarculaceae archaeon]